MKKFKVRQTVGAGACDPSGRMSLIGALNLIQDAVTATMAKLELDGFSMRRKYGAIIVFSKNHLKFLHDIRWQDKIVIECFFSMKSLARLNVDVCVKKAGTIALYARTEVCAVDIKSGRLCRTDAVGIGNQVKVLPSLYDLSWDKMDSEGKLKDTVTIRTGNIDYAGHTNNVEYIRLLLDTFTLEEWRTMAPKELQVAYLNQSFLGDKLAIYAVDQQLSDQTHERIYTLKKDQQDVLRCSIRW